MPLPGHGNAAAQFDEAKCTLDDRCFGDCIRESKGLLNMWEKQCRATTKNLIADVVKVIVVGPKGTSDVICSTRSGRR